MYIPVILGTAREGRRSEAAAKFMLAESQKFGFESELLDVRDYRLPATDITAQSPVAQEYIKKIERASGLIIVAPEYNHGYPGELKMMLDLTRQPYAFKPVGLCGVSIGPWGGTRMIEQLRQVCADLRLVDIRETINFPFVAKLFDENGRITDAGFAAKTQTFFDELNWYAETLAAARLKNDPLKLVFKK